MRKLILFLFLILLVVPIIEAKQGHMKLLAVKEVNDDYEGAIADLYLEIKDGTGRVFLDTFPLTKLDTQISTRFAKDVACSYLDMDCSNYDFIYTIKADSSIVAGPSAGGAITILTAALLEDYQLDNGVSITGTINSGGIIGTVGGIKEKIDAASENGINKVLIPEGERFVKEDRKVIEKTTITIGGNKTRENASITNKTIDLVEYGKEKGLEVIEVSDIGEALHEFTGIVFEKEEYEISIDKDYESTMSFLANKLCDRRDLLLEKAETYEIYDLEVNRSMKSILNLTSRSKLALENGKDYSAASYCFGANVELTYILLYLENNTEEDIEEKIEIIERNTKKLEGVINKRKKKTVTDLEAYAIVKERLIESEDYKKKILEENITKQSIHDLAYSFERVYSAFSWANFFDHRGREYDFNKEQLENSCHDKMAEAEERYQYVSLFYPA
ncbi:MAG: S16 family serine protease, partial [Nanoarchaeota archaeon]|nr:S16 family serine protease [Nanoarchaeota archaeon]